MLECESGRSKLIDEYPEDALQPHPFGQWALHRLLRRNRSGREVVAGVGKEQVDKDDMSDDLAGAGAV